MSDRKTRMLHICKLTIVSGEDRGDIQSMTMHAWLLVIVVISQGMNSVGAINQMDSLLAASCVFLPLLADFSEGGVIVRKEDNKNKSSLAVAVGGDKKWVEEFHGFKSCVVPQDCNKTQRCVFSYFDNCTEAGGCGKCVGPGDTDSEKCNCDIHNDYGPGAYVGLVVPLVIVVLSVAVTVCLVCCCCGWCCFKGSNSRVRTPESAIELAQREGTVNQQGDGSVSPGSESSVTRQSQTALSLSVEGRSDGSFRSQGSTAPLNREPSNSCPSSSREEVDSNESPEVHIEDERQERITKRMRQLMSSVSESFVCTTGRRKETQPPDSFSVRVNIRDDHCRPCT